MSVLHNLVGPIVDNLRRAGQSTAVAADSGVFPDAPKQGHGEKLPGSRRLRLTNTSINDGSGSRHMQV